jgi:hypothetical protein
MSTIKAGHEQQSYSPVYESTVPESVLGFNTEAALRLGALVTPLHVLPPKVERIIEHLNDAISILPLIEKVTTQPITTPEDIAPYLHPIKNIAADRVGSLIFSKRFEGFIDRRITQEFPTRANDAMRTVKEKLATVEHDVAFMSDIENPQEQFVQEFNTVSQQVKFAIRSAHQERINTAVKTSKPQETPKGLLGVAVRVYRKIKSFFGFFNQKPAQDQEVSAQDAGVGIHNVLNSLSSASDTFPMLSHMVFNRLPVALINQLSPYKLGLVADELLQFLSSLSDDDDLEKIKQSVANNPHELRFLTLFKRQYGKYSLDAYQKAALDLAPAIRDFMPTSGNTIADALATIRTMCSTEPIRQFESKRQTFKEKTKVAASMVLRRRSTRSL